MFYECDDSNIQSYADDTTLSTCDTDTDTISRLQSLSFYLVQI